jgi:CDP-glucose 4,6-dehydratase
VIVTSDKCYENRETLHAYSEGEPLGGYDPYSSSKACAEIVTSAYRRSFLAASQAAAATVRAGNVIGGGDWARDRLVPDLMRAFSARETAMIRNPSAVRPWQHAVEPLSGCLMLAEKLATEGQSYAEAWNFGPDARDARTVGDVVRLAALEWGPQARWTGEQMAHPHEATLLNLDASKARARLGWRPRWSLETAMNQTVRWYKGLAAGDDMRDLTRAQIGEFMEVGGD